MTCGKGRRRGLGPRGMSSFSVRLKPQDPACSMAGPCALMGPTASDALCPPHTRALPTRCPGVPQSLQGLLSPRRIGPHCGRWSRPGGCRQVKGCPVPGHPGRAALPKFRRAASGSKPPGSAAGGVGSGQGRPCSPASQPCSSPGKEGPGGWGVFLVQGGPLSVECLAWRFSPCLDSPSCLPHPALTFPVWGRGAS